MTLRVALVLAVSAAAVAAIFICGRIADKGDAGEADAEKGKEQK